MLLELNHISDYRGDVSKSAPLHVITIGALQIYFSYSTPVAYRTGGDLVVSNNVWSNTTGRHLNIINPDKSIRINNQLFNSQLNDLLNRGDI